MVLLDFFLLVRVDFHPNLLSTRLSLAAPSEALGSAKIVVVIFVH